MGHQEVRDMFDQARRNLSVRDVEDKVWKFQPYDDESRGQNVTLEKVKLFTRSVKMAQDNPSRAREILSQKTARAILDTKESMLCYLGPLLHPGRYTSYGRHFTLPNILAAVVHRLMDYLAVGDQVVDCSCGSNAFIAQLKSLCEGKEINFKAFDLFTPKDTNHWERASWFEIHKGQLNSGDHLVIGLNPPFGKNGSLAIQFVSHAAEFQPRVMVLIVPPKTPVPKGYVKKHEDTSLCIDRSFYVPGIRQSSWNAVPPAFRILERISPPIPTDLQYLRPQDAHMLGPVISEEELPPIPNSTDGCNDGIEDELMLQGSSLIARMPFDEHVPSMTPSHMANALPGQSIINLQMIGMGPASVANHGPWKSAVRGVHSWPAIGPGCVSAPQAMDCNSGGATLPKETMAAQCQHCMGELPYGTNSLGNPLCHVATGRAPSGVDLVPTPGIMGPQLNGGLELVVSGAADCFQVDGMHMHHVDRLRPGRLYQDPVMPQMHIADDHEGGVHGFRRVIVTGDVKGMDDESMDGDLAVVPGIRMDGFRCPNVSGHGKTGGHRGAENGHLGQHCGKQWPTKRG
ncbi:unnamed protein product [Ostreobium quekettii]|uniref:DM2 domain-containing protein n=1 Tax=Ostreobium quekettii TaxID=121088 RepID=A0A8S1J9N4_9CHLO|nr:unnamed protein product [Ostreobium quekettii]